MSKTDIDEMSWAEYGAYIRNWIKGDSIRFLLS